MHANELEEKHREFGLHLYYESEPMVSARVTSTNVKIIAAQAALARVFVRVKG